MGILEWVGAHLLGPIVSLYRTIQARPRPDIRILELTPTGGGTYVDFAVHIQNYGTQATRANVTAHVGDQGVQVAPEILDLLPNARPKRVAVYVPRPGLGDLVPEFNHETTLYDQTLTVEVIARKHRAARKWHELVYERGANKARYEIQQRV
jgi:hypothetical protein